MIKFREKKYSMLLGALTVGTTALSLGQGNKQMKESQKQADQMERSNMAIAKQLNKIASTNDPTKIQAAGNLMQQNFSVGSILKTTASTAKDLGKIALKNKKLLVSTASIGALTAAGNYVADKAIQADLEKRGKTFSNAAKALKNIYKQTKPLSPQVARRRKELKSSITLGLGFGVVPPLLSYSSEKKAEQDLVSNMNKTQSVAPEKTFSVASTLSKAGKSTLNMVSTFMGGGGYRGVEKLGKQIKLQGYRSGNKVTEKIGKTILNNKTAAVAASIPIGAGIWSAGYSLGEKAVKMPLKAIDKKAYKYVESKEQNVQQ